MTAYYETTAEMLKDEITAHERALEILNRLRGSAIEKGNTAMQYQIEQMAENTARSIELTNRLLSRIN